MKLWLSALVAVLISSQSLLAAGNHEEGMTTPVGTTKPVAAAVEQEPDHVRLAKFMNACVLEQGVTPQPESIARSIGADVIR